jgi:hypothetical protein
VKPLTGRRELLPAEHLSEPVQELAVLLLTEARALALRVYGGERQCRVLGNLAA